MSEILTSPLHLHFFASWLMTGVLWTIQMVHYPLFAQIGKSEFVDYQHEHQALITRLVAPLMLLEMATATVLLFGGIGLVAGWISQGVAIFVITALIWLVTFFVQVPLHGKLSEGKSTSTVRKLVRTNWIRTLLWTLKSVLVSSVVFSA